MDWLNLNADKDRWLTKHYTSGRSGRKIEFVVIHYNGGNLTTEGCYAVWQTRQASAHYQVESDGTVGQLVHDRDTAWHAGNWDANCRSIGIEHANVGDTVTDACLDAGAHLTAAVCRAYGLGRPEWMANVFPHMRFASTDCPGPLREGTGYNARYMDLAGRWYDAMQAGRDTLEPEKTPLPDALKGFADLDGDAWYVSAVETAVESGWMGGYGNGTFGPDDALTRAQACAVLSNFAGETHEGAFEDVEPGNWYYDAVTWAADKGVVSGHGGEFGPDGECTREAFAVMLHNLRGKPTPVGEPSGMADWGEVSGWAKDAVAWAVESGIMGSTGKVRPQDACTRAEACAMLCNI